MNSNELWDGGEKVFNGNPVSPRLKFSHPTVLLTSMVESYSRVRKQLYLPLYHSNLRRIGTTANAVTEAQESGVESDKRVSKIFIYNY